jgi:hypothetical protein
VECCAVCVRYCCPLGTTSLPLPTQLVPGSGYNDSHNPLAAQSIKTHSPNFRPKQQQPPTSCVRPEATSAAMAMWVKLGRATSKGVSGAAIGCLRFFSVQMPDGPRKSGMPTDVEMPAPANTNTGLPAAPDASTCRPPKKRAKSVLTGSFC